MELRHLRYFVAVAEELHFGRAAARLHIAQPPLSQQIKALETELGVQLFRRSRRHVELTDAGRLFLEEARATLLQARRAEETARAAAAGKRGHLAIGFVTSAAYSVLPGAVQAFRAAHPGVDLTLHDMSPSRQLDALERREIDVGLLRPPVKHPGIQTETVMDEPLVVALPRSHPLASRRRLALAALKQETLVLFPRRHGPGLHDVIVKVCMAAGFTPAPAYEPDDMQSILVHVAGGLGVSLVPCSWSGFHPDDITYRPLQPPGACVELAMAWAERRESPLAQAFCHAAAEAGRACLTRVRRHLAGQHR